MRKFGTMEVLVALDFCCSITYRFGNDEANNQVTHGVREAPDPSSRHAIMARDNSDKLPCKSEILYYIQYEQYA